MLRILNFKIDLADDEVFEPWVWIPAVFEDKEPLFGVPVKRELPSGAGSYRYQPVIASLEDIGQITILNHRIDEPATALRQERVEEQLNLNIPDLSTCRANG